MSHNSEPQQETNRLLLELVTYARANAAATLRELASKVINTHAKTIAYQNLKGSRTQSEVAKLAGVTQAAVSLFCTDFVKAGIATPPGNFSKYHKALFTLDELGIDPQHPSRDKSDSHSREPSTQTLEPIQDIPNDKQRSNETTS